MIKAIISDLGRVILDFDHKISISKLSNLINIPVEELSAFIYQSNIDIAFDSGEISAEEFHKYLDSRFNFGISFDNYFSRAYITHIRVIFCH